MFLGPTRRRSVVYVPSVYEWAGGSDVRAHDGTEPRVRARVDPVTCRTVYRRLTPVLLSLSRTTTNSTPNPTSAGSRPPPSFRTGRPFSTAVPNTDTSPKGVTPRTDPKGPPDRVGSGPVL